MTMTLMRSLSLFLAVWVCAACSTDSLTLDRWRAKRSSLLPEPEIRMVVQDGPQAIASDEATSKEKGRLRPREAFVSLADVVQSVETHFPDLIAARESIEIAQAELLSAEGAFDPSLSASAKLNREFYDTETFDVEISQPTPILGARLFTGYRIGRGNFASYDGDISTNRGGEFRFGFELPLLRDSTIDRRRAEVWRARIRRDAADPFIQQKRIELIRKASIVYWKWLAAGRKLRVFEDLLRIAEERQESLRISVDAGQLGEIILVENERLVVERRGLTIRALRKLENVALTLSLFLRDEQGRLLVPTPEAVPSQFPPTTPLDIKEIDAHVMHGLRHRPEMAMVSLAETETLLDIELNENRLLPRLDLAAATSQDIGNSNSALEQDDRFKYGVGLKFEVPFRFREAKGKLRASEAKQRQIAQKARLVADRIEMEVRDASSAYRRARERLTLAQRDLELARRMEAAERTRLAEGDTDLLRINIREQQTARARSNLIDIEELCFDAVANYEAAIGLPRVQAPADAAR